MLSPAFQLAAVRPRFLQLALGTTGVVDSRVLLFFLLYFPLKTVLMGSTRAPHYFSLLMLYAAARPALHVAEFLAITVARRERRSVTAGKYRSQRARRALVPGVGRKK